MPKASPSNIQQVHKPMLTGSWHGKDAYRLGLKRMLGMVGISVLYLVLGVMLSLDSLWIRVVLALFLVAAITAYEFSQGVKAGETDAAFSEIMYERKEEGKEIPQGDLERCFHPVKGFWAVFVGVLPFFLIALGFSLVTRPVLYTLGALPNWVEGLTRQNEFGDALGYYQTSVGMGFMDIYRIVVRAMVMPFINVATLLGESAVLWVERLSPLLLCIAPLGFAMGYTKGPKVRTRIHTGILIGDSQKKRKERRARQKRKRGDSPQRLI